MLLLLLIAVGFLAYCNGANDNVKGVASLIGSRTCSYRMAISWATVTTAAGSAAAAGWAGSLVERFSGKGLVPDTLVGESSFLLAVALGAGLTVLLATLLGLPVSTTHGLTGALLGAGLMAAGSDAVHFGALGRHFVLPLLLFPVLAVVVGALVYLGFRLWRLTTGIHKEVCVCVGSETRILPVGRPAGVFAIERMPSLKLAAGDWVSCRQRYRGFILGIRAGSLVDVAHVLSAGAVSFARGLNDTPKIAGLLVMTTWFPAFGNLLLVGAGIALGGWLNARRVAETMANRITDMNPGQGFSANLATALLVTGASVYGMPVSTTHVSVGSLLGMGWVTGQAKWKPVLGILMSWIVTLPCAAGCAAIVYGLLRPG